MDNMDITNILRIGNERKSGRGHYKRLLAFKELSKA